MIAMADEDHAQTAGSGATGWRHRARAQAQGSSARRPAFAV